MSKFKGYKIYFTYVLKHKYYVGKMCFNMGLYWQGLVHDLSKFIPCEYKSYMRYFSLGDKSEETKIAFDYSWNHHLHSNKHHRQYWILRNDDGSTRALDMPDKYIKEMLCDWWGVGRAFMKDEDKWKYDYAPWHEVYHWYYKNKDNMQLSIRTRQEVENFLESCKTKELLYLERDGYETGNSGKYRCIYNPLPPQTN